MQNGVYIPLVTPFHHGVVDYASFGKMIDYYIDKGITGLFVAATTGEAPTLADDEYFSLVSRAIDHAGGRVPVYAGLSEHCTQLLTAYAARLESFPVAGILSCCPYYNLPAQQGIYEHFLRLSEATSHDIILYNIPYRTGRNIENNTIRRLAQLENIVGLKDSCGNIEQSMELLLDRPEGFSIFAGHDTDFFCNLALGGEGGILASAHLRTNEFVRIVEEFRSNRIDRARELWAGLLPVIPLLFAEPNPAPVKYLLAQHHLIRSDDVRLPLTGISPELKQRLNSLIAEPGSR